MLHTEIDVTIVPFALSARVVGSLRLMFTHKSCGNELMAVTIVAL